MSSTKDRAKRFFHKIVNPKEQDESFAPPEKSTSNSISPELLHSFKAFGLSDTHHNNRAPHFVGGFNPGVFVTNRPLSVPVSYPHMPTPSIPQSVSEYRAGQSLTMKMALHPEGHYDKATEGPGLPKAPMTAFPEPATTSRLPTSRPTQSASARPLRPRATSAPAISRNQSSTAQQCAGITKTGKQCARLVKVAANNLSGESVNEVFCHQHLEKLMSPSGFYSRKDGAWVDFAERLIHIELADLQTSAIYLTPTWPDVSRRVAGPSLSSKKSVTNSTKPPPCEDCGSHHKEIFEFKRLAGPLQGQEWEKIVEPVIQKWGRFVGQCL
ncbi:hypothetical protein DXG01_014519 [Tephrocybe rancida]|nr:hypothetical protein DXG01_014519 [Tephrocybe rancida]